MTEDARFEDGAEKPLRLKALEGDDLQVLAGLCQDAVFPASEMTWRAKDRRFALLLNRFRWEDQRDPPERIQSVLTIEDVMAVRSTGVPRGEANTVLSLLTVTFEPDEDGTGVVRLTLAGDGEIECRVEALEVLLRDVTRPYIAPSRATPDHDA